MKYVLSVSTFLMLLSCTSQKESGQKLTKADFEDRWPLTVDEGIIDCVNQAVIFKTNSKTYAVNGTATNSKKYLDIIEIWGVDTAYHDPNIRMDISPLIDVGLKLCK